MDTEQNKSLLLHTCCGPCASGCLWRLEAEGRTCTLFFSNSNLCSRAEYDRRLAAAETVAAHYGVELIADPYDHAAWLEAVRGLEAEPERGARCGKCFAFSLCRTAEAASRLGRNFATTLTVSPHKNSRTIFAIGSAWDHFESWDFKKQDGFKRSVENSLALDLYRQNFCGCEFSMRTQTNDKTES